MRKRQNSGCQASSVAGFLLSGAYANHHDDGNENVT